MLKYKYRQIRPITGLTLHTEKLSITSQVKDYFLRALSSKNLLVGGSRGPARVEKRLLGHLNNFEQNFNKQIDWILNVNHEKNWSSMDLHSTSLILGPNIEFERSFIKEKIQNYVDSVILVPSYWVIPVLKARLQWYQGKFQVWKSDLDTEYWKPSKFNNKKYILIYRKNDHLDEDFRKVVTICNRLGIKHKALVYGNYNQRSFRRILRKSYFVIWLGMTESQGIALLESWSTNTPTYVRESNTFVDELSGNVFAASSAPYLTDSCGEFFRAENLDVKTIKNFMKISERLSPRDYVLENYSKSKIDQDLRAIFSCLNS